jgi:AcrR family transcriptional regulator
MRHSLIKKQVCLLEGGQGCAMSGAEERVPVRQRILEAASEMFYREGVRAVGIDAIIARSGVAK